jgi:hypothetical protein
MDAGFAISGRRPFVEDVQRPSLAGRQAALEDIVLAPEFEDSLLQRRPLVAALYFD